MEAAGRIQRAFSDAGDTRAAIDELAERLAATAGDLVVLFVSPDHDSRAVERAVPECFGEVDVVACSTAGEITPTGIREGSVTGFALPGHEFAFEIVSIEPLSRLTLRSAAEAATGARARLEARVGRVLGADDAFALLLSDGLSMQEERLAAGVHQGLGEIPLVGGSAGDGTDFVRTWLYHRGSARDDRALLVVVHTSRRILPFKTEHFRRTRQAHVVTEADPMRRIVCEIDAEPAAEAYACMVGVDVDALGPAVFARHPLAIRIGDHLYVRSVQRVVDGQGLLFYCAIEEGIILHEVVKEDMLSDLEASFSRAEAVVGNFDLVIGFDCILRHLEARENRVLDAVGELLSRANVIGFSTYGEQLGSRHINQTFTALAIGDAR